MDLNVGIGKGVIHACILRCSTIHMTNYNYFTSAVDTYASSTQAFPFIEYSNLDGRLWFATRASLLLIRNKEKHGKTRKLSDTFISTQPRVTCPSGNLT